MASVGEADVFLRVLLLGLAALLTLLSLASARRLSNRRLLLLGAAFAAFTAKGLLLVLAVFVAPLSPLGQSLELTAVDMAVVGLVYLATIVPSPGRARP